MNAAKYGALSIPADLIDVKWTLISEEDGRKVVFDWRESRVRIEDTNPAKGFGSQVIESSLPHLLGGTSELRFGSDGVVRHLAFPLPRDGKGES